MALRIFSLPVCLISLVMMMSFYMTGLRVGPFLIRIYFIIILLVWMLLGVFSHRRKIVRSFFGARILQVWLVLIVWKIISGYGNGSPMQGVYRQLFANDIFAVILFLTIMYFVRSRKEISFLVHFLILLTVVSVVVGIMQFLNYSWAWQLQGFLNPDSDLALRQSGTRRVLGLSGRIFTFGYYLASVGPLVASWLLLGKRAWWYFLEFFLLIIGNIILQERSALLAFAVCSLIGLRAWSARLKRPLLIIFVVVVLAAGGYAMFNWAITHAGSYGRYSLSRMTDWSDQERTELLSGSLRLIPKAALWGVSREEFTLQVAGAAPHNLFLNAIVYYGVAGLALTCILLVLFFKLCMKLWKTAWQEDDYLSVGLVLALAGHIINSMFHNASFVSGDWLVWFIVALLVKLFEQKHLKDASGYGQ